MSGLGTRGLVRPDDVGTQRAEHGAGTRSARVCPSAIIGFEAMNVLRDVRGLADAGASTSACRRHAPWSAEHSPIAGVGAVRWQISAGGREFTDR